MCVEVTVCNIDVVFRDTVYEKKHINYIIILFPKVRYVH